MEQLSIRSFLAHGHDIHLFTYQDVQDIPTGTTVRSGEEILPADKVFTYQKGYGQGSYAGFADCFRYKLLLERGGWWTDLDMVCMRPIDLPDEHVLGKERARDGGYKVNIGVIKAPQGSSLMEYCWQAVEKVNWLDLTYAQTGPLLMTEAVGRMNGKIRPFEPEAFYPIDYWQVWQFITRRRLPPDCYMIHFWLSCWKRHGLNPDARFAPSCIYEQLKRRYGVETPDGAPKGPGLAARAWHWLRDR